VPDEGSARAMAVAAAIMTARERIHPSKSC
jgi:hypothetical protein